MTCCLVKWFVARVLCKTGYGLLLFQLNAHLAYSFIVSNPFVILHANIWFLTFQWASM